METGLAGFSGDDVYEVERILKKRYHSTKGVQYYVKWRHFPSSENTWEPACNFTRNLIDDYESSHKSKKQKLSSLKTSAKSRLNGGATSTSITSSSSSSTTTTTTTTATTTTIATSSLTAATTTTATATTTAVAASSLDATTTDDSMPSSSSSLISSCSSSATLITTESKPKRGRPRKNSTLRRQQQVQLQLHIQQQQQQKTLIGKQHLAVFNPVGEHSLDVVKEVVYEPELTKEPIVVTDVTAKDLTVTISECRTPEGFFSM